MRRLEGLYFLKQSLSSSHSLYLYVQLNIVWLIVIWLKKGTIILEAVQRLERLVEYVETAQFIDLCAIFLYALILGPPDDPAR